MKTSNKLILATLLVTTLTVIPFYLSHTFKKEVSETDNQNTFDSKNNDYNFENYVNQLENEVWQGLKELNISKESCLAKIKEIKATQSQDDALKNNPMISGVLSPNIITFAQSVISGCGINPDIVKIVSTNDPSPAFVDEYKILYINETELKSYSADAAQWVIAHECQHLIHDDINLRLAVHALLPQEFKNAWGQGNPDAPLNKLLLFSEIRADIGAALAQEKFALGYCEFAK